MKLSEEVKSHLFAVRTTGGQEKVVMNLLETRSKMNKINIQSVLLVDNLKGYVVLEALDPSAAYQAIEGIRHIRGQLRGELDFKDKFPAHHHCLTAMKSCSSRMNYRRLMIF